VIWRLLLALFVVVTGVLHFIKAPAFVAMVPASLPRPDLLVAVSGVAEIAGGLGILWPPTRRAAGIGLILLFLAVFPANINMAVNHLPLDGKPVPPALLWGRLVLQPVFIWWAWRVAVRRRSGTPRDESAPGAV
jgi:uncharacterized membrane protein